MAQHFLQDACTKRENRLNQFGYMRKNFSVLIVEDSSLIVTKIRELLEEVEVISQILACGTCKDGFEMLQEFIPDVILLDINLPDYSGIDLLRYCKNSSPETIVIMLTNQVGEYYKSLCLGLGADYFLDKSKDFDKIPELFMEL